MKFHCLEIALELEPIARCSCHHIKNAELKADKRFGGCMRICSEK